uniref:Uncharacterized protein n=1 Tax=Arundo donax TaxID=35708 RepID=A0A0A9BG66_ARUDO
MDKMNALNEKAYDWLQNMSPNTRVRAFFSEFPKCDILLNNSCEVFDKYILDARELPILSMLQTIKAQLTSRHYTKHKDGKENLMGPICPKIRQKVLKNAEMEKTCYVCHLDGAFFRFKI